MQPGTLVVLWVVLAFVGYFVIGGVLGYIAFIRSSQVIAGFAIGVSIAWVAFALVMVLINLNVALGG